MILIALGGNLPGPWGTPPATLDRAVREVAALPGLALDARSAWYRSRPVPRSGQPDYVNGVLRLRGVAEPAALLMELQRLEAAAGRVAGARNAARPLDLDIIDMDGLVRDGPDPVLPHPRACLRGFVLRPLLEVAPDWIEPRLGVALDRLLERLGPDDGCERLDRSLD